MSEGTFFFPSKCSTTVKVGDFYLFHTYIEDNQISCFVGNDQILMCNIVRVTDGIYWYTGVYRMFLYMAYTIVRCKHTYNDVYM